MPHQDVQTIQSTTFEGVLTPWIACVCAVAIALTAAWLLWRERRALGRPWPLVFWLLRVIACSVVLWMLMGPARLTILRTTSPQMIAVFVDKSDSMTVADANNPADELRWSLAAETVNPTSLVENCDRAVASLTVARKQCQQVAESVAAHAPIAHLRDSTEAIAKASTRALGHIERAVESVGTYEQGLADRAGQIDTLLRGPVKEQCATIRTEIDRGGVASLDALTQHLQTLLEYLNGAERRATSLAEDVANRVAAANPTSSPTQGVRTRREHVDAAVDALQKGPLSALASKCLIEHFQFAKLVTSADESSSEPVAATTPQIVPVSAPARTPTPAPIDSGAATNLTSALDAINHLRLQGSLRLALVYSDGRHNAPDSQPPQEAAAKLTGQPVYFVPSGTEKQLRDVAIGRVDAPTVVKQNDKIGIEVLITARDCKNEQLNLSLRQNGREIERRKITVKRDPMDHREVFRVQADKLGWQRYELVVDELEEEASTTNNLAAVSFEVVQDKFRVLLADRSPRWEYRYLLQLFRRDKHVEFDDLLFLPKVRATGRLEKSKGMPQTADEWAFYDVVILGDLGPQQLNDKAQQSLMEYVTRRGGHLILIAGAENMPAAFAGKPFMELVPVESAGLIPTKTGFNLTLPEQALLESPMLVRESYAESLSAWRVSSKLMPVYGLNEYCLPKPATRPLVYAVPKDATAGSSLANKRVFFCWRPIGAGRVAYLSAPQTYLLRFLRGDRDHHRFWGQTLRWITAAQVGAGSELVRLLTDRTIYEAGQPTEVIAWLRDKSGRPISEADLNAEARSAGKSAASIRLVPDAVPGRYSGTFERLPPGNYDITLVGSAVEELAPNSDAAPFHTEITVGSSSNFEMLDTQANRPLLEQLAELTGGQVLPPTAVAEILEQTSLDPKVTEISERHPLWNRWSYLCIVLGCLFTEWVVRKHKGLA